MLRSPSPGSTEPIHQSRRQETSLNVTNASTVTVGEPEVIEIGQVAKLSGQGTRGIGIVSKQELLEGGNVAELMGDGAGEEIVGK
ncbi:unnamed protein product [Linum trigynum]|uniref:Uncharacterized protein n=1 Tax=Linum trigynum TaxID=586398 RepID=A0AAV2E1N0_9ROSI